MHKNSEDLIRLNGVAYRRSPQSNFDQVGIVYYSDENFIRIINYPFRNHVKNLFNSGLIKELSSRKLIPATEILIDDEEDLVLSHEKIRPLLYPAEWSPAMLKRAAKLVLDVLATAEKYGFELKDCHPFNIVFEGACPRFVDIGSLVPIESSIQWIAYHEFLSCYYYPLLAWSKGYQNTYKTLVLRNGVGFAESRALLGSSFFNGCIESAFWISRITRKLPSSKNIQKKIAKKVGVRTLIHSYLLKKINFDTYKTKTNWSNYHHENYYRQGDPYISNRFSWILEIVANLDIESVIDIAGNQGVLACEIAKIPHVNTVICCDYDANAVDKLLHSLEKTSNVFPAYFDVIAGAWFPESLDRAFRLKSDLVIALALSHHIVLSQGYSFSTLITYLSKYTKKYLILEFMPLGLWNGSHSQPLPSWYCEKNFVTALNSKFIVIQRAELGVNRVAYLCKIKSQ